MKYTRMHHFKKRHLKNCHPRWAPSNVWRALQECFPGPHCGCWQAWLIQLGSLMECFRHCQIVLVAANTFFAISGSRIASGGYVFGYFYATFSGSDRWPWDNCPQNFWLSENCWKIFFLRKFLSIWGWKHLFGKFGSKIKIWIIYNLLCWKFAVC